ncbi:ABC transporter ATP-binding protein [Falsirhodobacter xinxiangensis]|uniref:ABC transporter ATP-binding protein n=1 Tax=Falsirhodobacter xinxiangensis TaxID=2530049 RepID=UPI0010AB0680|nr:ABC transporter ATP-binding protein [Rhodobacter xinxiangensis]
MTGPVLSVRNLATSFRKGQGWSRVVNGISFDVAPRQTVAVVGESGSGKSVTAMSIMRLHNPEKSRVEGQVLLEGRDILALPEAQMRRIRGNDIAMIFQEAMTSLNPLHPIGKQISEAILLHNDCSADEAKQRAVALLDKVRIPSAASRYDDLPFNFSGGMRQRGMIAMALACKPKLLIADEPTTALDVTIQAQILDLIRELQREEGMGVVFITHDMGVVAEIADQVVVMNRGDEVESGSVRDIFFNATQPYTRKLLGAVPRLGSMAGEPLPRKFPEIDGVTGAALERDVMPDTVRHDQPPVLSITGVTTRFTINKGRFGRASGRVHAVENVSFDLMAGETLSIVGESGCGKSTLGKSILRLVKSQEGKALLNGRDLFGLSKSELRSARRDIQMIFQDPFASLDPRQSVGRAIAEPYLAHGMGTEAEAGRVVGDLLEQVGLSADMAQRLPHQFSGGQRQRICIARALALSPKVIVADESVSALDVSVKAQVINLMLDLQAKYGLSYLFISHDMAVVERISHRVAVLYMGEIVEIGPREAIFANPQHPYTKRLLAAVPIPDPDHKRPSKVADVTELRSPIRDLDFAPTRRDYRQIGEGHLVMA